MTQKEKQMAAGTTPSERTDEETPAGASFQDMLDWHGIPWYQTERNVRRLQARRWLLEGDIQSCFDKISHQWLLDHIPLEKDILRKWLKAGYKEQQTRSIQPGKCTLKNVLT